MMVRNIPVSLSLNFEEWEDLQDRSKKQHLNLATYIRWYLFDHHYEQPEEPIRSGVPKRIVSSKITQAVKKQNKMAFVIAEMHQQFDEKCVYRDEKTKELMVDPRRMLSKVTEEMKMEVYQHRMDDSKRIINVEELHPPR